MNCQVKGCDNPVFNDQDKCALHCDKSDYETDLESGLLEKFYNELESHINNIRHPKPLPVQNEWSNKFFNSELFERTSLLSQVSMRLPKAKLANPFGSRNRVNDNEILILDGIYFPEQKIDENADFLYQEILKEHMILKLFFLLTAN